MRQLPNTFSFLRDHRPTTPILTFENVISLSRKTQILGDRKSSSRVFKLRATRVKVADQDWDSAAVTKTIHSQRKPAAVQGPVANSLTRVSNEK